MRIEASSAQIDDSSTAFSHHLGLHLFLGLVVDGEDPGPNSEAAKVEDTAPQDDRGPHPKVDFAQGDEGREEHHGVGAEVVRLKTIEIKKVLEEFAHREPKST